jgi:hypothetical protein
MGGACSTPGEMRNAYKILVGKTWREDTTRKLTVSPLHKKFPAF